MPYLVEIIDEDKRKDSRLFKEKTAAEDHYFRALAAVSQNSPVRTDSGKLVRLLGCYLHEVPTNEKNVAEAMVRENEARPVQSSDDSMCGEPIVVEGLFKIVN
jgi:hypothetical protein